MEHHRRKTSHRPGGRTRRELNRSVSLVGREPKQERQQHEAGAVARGHEEGPEGEIAEAHLHSASARMPVPRQAVEAEGEKDGRHGHLHRGQGKYPLGEAGERDDSADGRAMTDSQRRQGAPHRRAVFLLQPERDREKPAHARIDSVVGPQEKQRGPNPGIPFAHGKQKESVEQSPPSRRTWCGRSSSTSRRKLESNAIPPAGLASTLTIQPLTPSG